MSFLKKIFKKKPGGTFMGNLFRGVASAVPIVGGTVIGTGANKIEHGQTMTNKELSSFAGQPATQSPDGTINMTTPLNQVTVSSAKSSEPGVLEKMLGDKLSYLGQRSTENMQFGADNKTLMIVGGGLFAIVLLMFAQRR